MVNHHLDPHSQSNEVDKNYKQEKVRLPSSVAIEIRTELNKVQKHVSEKLGFKLTQNQTMVYLVNNYLKENGL